MPDSLHGHSDSECWFCERDDQHGCAFCDPDTTLDKMRELTRSIWLQRDDFEKKYRSAHVALEIATGKLNALRDALKAVVL